MHQRPGRKVRLSAASALLLGALGCGNPAASGSAVLEGLVLRWPIAPVCREGESCSAPFVGQFELRRGGRRAVEFSTDSAGRFSVRVDPGHYVVAPRVQGLMGGQEQPVDVVDGRTEVTLTFDTGIR
jgi:hypothetical protein